jgi:2-polyprenyl-6-methoxyphenol hydroxylase-like FAD-dependent oxidoreductase
MVNEATMDAAPQTNGHSAVTPEFPALERTCEVCIIGAGIPGMICALLLKKLGIDVHIYERQGAIYPLPRAVVLGDESLSVAAKAGLGYELRNMMKSATAGVKDFVWVDENEETLERLDGHSRGCSGYPGITMFCQPVFEAAVASACVAAGVPIYRHWEFGGFQETDAVDGEYDISFKSYKGTNQYNPTMNVRAKWLIGADGANSSVRKAAGIEQVDFGLCYDWLIVDCVSLIGGGFWSLLSKTLTIAVGHIDTGRRLIKVGLEASLRSRTTHNDDRQWQRAFSLGVYAPSSRDKRGAL